MGPSVDGRVPGTCHNGHVGGPLERRCRVCGEPMFRPCRNGHWMPVGPLLCPTCRAQPAAPAIHRPERWRPEPWSPTPPSRQHDGRPVWPYVAVAGVQAGLAGLLIALH